MAAAYCATTFFLLPPSFSQAQFSRKLLLVRSASSVSPPSIKLHRKIRKNYLRPKILKTLIKPIPDPLLPDPPPFTIPEEIIVEPQPEYTIADDQLIEEELKESESLQVSVADVNNVKLGKFSNFTVFRIGLFLVGAFVFQTVCAVLLFGSGQNGILEDETRVLGLNGDGVVKSKLLMNGSGIVYVDEAEMKKKISEIQVMARDVREKERRELKNGSSDDVGVDISWLEKEVNRQLKKLEKGVKKKKLSIGYTSNDKVDEDGLVSGNVDEALIFKKLTPKSPSDKAKCSQSLDDHNNISKVKNSSAVFGNEVLEKTSDDGMNLLDNVQTLDLPNGDLVRSDSINFEGNDGRDTPVVRRKKLSKGKERAKLGKPEPLNGKAVNLNESNKINGSSSLRSTYDQNAPTIVHEDGFLISDLESTKGGCKASIEEVTKKKSVSQTESWWLTLPYVLAVVMRTGGDDEEANGLYTIKNYSHSGGGSSHVVAFEDRGDATNFCYLLQSFFEDMAEFSTDIVPIPIKDLDEAVKSHMMKVVVVKKGQLRLYAGQPLSDVEMTLQLLLAQANLP